jgi:serine/threonine protein kinase
MASGDLFDLASTLARMPWASSRPLYQEITGQILDQVGAMHDLDVVHSDIKLENILFWQDGTIALNDFGAAFGVWERDDIASGYLSYTHATPCWRRATSGLIRTFRRFPMICSPWAPL